MSVVVELPISQQPSRVFTPDLSERIAAVSEARRRLKELGQTVLGQALLQGTRKRPVLTIERPSARTALEFRGRLTSVLMEPHATCNVITGRLGGVDVTWVETHRD